MSSCDVENIECEDGVSVSVNALMGGWGASEADGSPIVASMYVTDKDGNDIMVNMSVSQTATLMGALNMAAKIARDYHKSNGTWPSHSGKKKKG